jgi:hypothetical protein
VPGIGRERVQTIRKETDGEAHGHGMGRLDPEHFATERLDRFELRVCRIRNP